MLNEELIRDYIRNIVQKPVEKDTIFSYLMQEDKNITQKEIEELLCTMISQGELVQNRKGRYGTPEQFHMVKGILRKNAKGFGFLERNPEDGLDLYIASKDIAGAMNGDLVLAQIKREGIVDINGTVLARPEGKITKILERKNNRIVGRLEMARFFGFVIPDDKKFGSDIFISGKNLNGARDGMKVLVEITGWPEPGKKAEGCIVQVLGKPGAPGVDMMSIIYEYELPQQFPVAVMEAAEAIPENIPAEEYGNRRDLRNVRMVTIDGDDAKDLDDAVSLEMMPEGQYLLGVHIADVGHYVKEDSVLDVEAFQRATSVYLADRVIPMLPQKLSNGLCSLNEQEDRLALSCFMLIGKNGEIKSHDICESVIRVNHRLTYKNVNKMLLEQDIKLAEKYHDVVPMLKNMAKLQATLEKKRKNRGAITFELPESKVILDKKGRAVRIEWRESLIAEKMIEEFMLAANETVAEHYFWMEVPFLYRVHEEPAMEDVLTLNRYLQSVGYSIKGSSNGVHPREYQQIIDAVAGTEMEMIVNRLLLRSMQHARYATDPLGHFGLAAKYYSHFTSPIRRYPDLAIHRIIKELIHNENTLSENRLAILKDKTERYAEQSSMQEKRAEEAERDSVDMKKAEYMKPYVGEEFDAKISGVTGFGLFVQLENSVEGLVHITTLLNDYYQYDAERMTLEGENTGNIYQIGQTVKVRLTRVSVEERQIDFEVVTENEGYYRKSKSKTRL